GHVAEAEVLQRRRCIRVEQAQHAVVGGGRPGSGGRPPPRAVLAWADAPAEAPARARILFELWPSTGANAYWTWIGGVVTWRAFDPSGHPAPGPGGPAGRTQQTTSPLASVPSIAQPAAPGTRPSTLA